MKREGKVIGTLLIWRGRSGSAESWEDEADMLIPGPRGLPLPFSSLSSNFPSTYRQIAGFADTETSAQTSNGRIASPSFIEKL